MRGVKARRRIDLRGIVILRNAKRKVFVNELAYRRFDLRRLKFFHFLVTIALIRLPKIQITGGRGVFW